MKEGCESMFCQGRLEKKRKMEPESLRWKSFRDLKVLREGRKELA